MDLYTQVVHFYQRGHSRWRSSLRVRSFHGEEFKSSYKILEYPIPIYLFSGPGSSPLQIIFMVNVKANSERVPCVKFSFWLDFLLTKNVFDLESKFSGIRDFKLILLKSEDNKNRWKVYFYFEDRPPLSIRNLIEFPKSKHYRS